MNPHIQNLYKQTLLTHSKQPLNNHALPDSPSTTLRNPLCGDEITLYRKTNDDGTEQITFTAQACTICLAAASMLTQHLATLPPPEAQAFAQTLVSSFQNAKKPFKRSENPEPVEGQNPEPINLPNDLAALTGVLAFPSRIRCATLPFEAYLALPTK